MRRAGRRAALPRRPALAGVVVFTVTALAFGSAGTERGILFLLPCILLLIALLAGRYPGERLIERVASNRRPRRRREAARPERRRVWIQLLCAGRLAASGLDSRAPPSDAVPSVASATA